jgi:hypothetical protein
MLMSTLWPQAPLRITPLCSFFARSDGFFAKTVFIRSTGRDHFQPDDPREGYFYQRRIPLSDDQYGVISGSIDPLQNAGSLTEGMLGIAIDLEKYGQSAPKEGCWI